MHKTLSLLSCLVNCRYLLEKFPQNFRELRGYEPPQKCTTINTYCTKLIPLSKIIMLAAAMVGDSAGGAYHC